MQVMNEDGNDGSLDFICNGKTVHDHGHADCTP